MKLDTQSPVAEAYRSVRTSLYLGTAREARTVLVASPAPGDGKSTTASNLAILLAPAPGDEAPRLAVVQVPARLPRLVRPAGIEGTTYVLIEDIVRSELPALFPGQEIREAAVFRVARDAELDFDDEGGGDLLEVIEEELKNRRRSGIVRLEIETGVGEEMLEVLAYRLDRGLGERRDPVPERHERPPPEAVREPARHRLADRRGPLGHALDQAQH